MKCLAVLLVIFFIHPSFSQGKENTMELLPATVYGEWFNPTDHSYYQSVLIQKNFIEHNFMAYRFTEVKQLNVGKYEVVGENYWGESLKYCITILNKDAILLQRDPYQFNKSSGKTVWTIIPSLNIRMGNNQISKLRSKANYIRDTTLGKSVNIKDVPLEIKGTWHTTEKESKLDFEISNNEFKFKGENYRIDNITKLFRTKDYVEQYRFVVSKDDKSILFYFKNWSKDYVQIGFKGTSGVIYMNKQKGNITNHSYPKVVSSLPKTIIGEWTELANLGEYNGMLIHPNFIEYVYTAYMYEKITKINDHKYEIVTKSDLGDKLLCKLLILNDNAISIKRGDDATENYVRKSAAGKDVTIKEVPSEIKQSWYATNAESLLKFQISDSEFNFRGEAYVIDEIKLFYGDTQYRFVVSKGEKSWIFYFKKWNDAYVQIGLNGHTGDLYKNKKTYPNSRPYIFFD